MKSEKSQELRSIEEACLIDDTNQANEIEKTGKIDMQARSIDETNQLIERKKKFFCDVGSVFSSDTM